MCAAGWIIGPLGGGVVGCLVIKAGKVWLVWEAVDMRAGVDRLSGWIQESLVLSGLRNRVNLRGITRFCGS